MPVDGRRTVEARWPDLVPDPLQVGRLPMFLMQVGCGADEAVS